MTQIFISYAYEDRAFAQRMAHVLEQQGWSVWWDKQIPPGMDYAQVIEKAVNAASCIVVLWSKHSIGSRWVHTEAAVGADRQVVATVIVDDTTGDEIPFEFRRLQAVDLAEWKPGVAHAGFAALTNRIRSILDEPLQPLPTKDSAGSPSTWSDVLTLWGTGKQRLLRAAAVVAGFLGVVVGSVAYDRGDDQLLIGTALLIVSTVVLFHLGRKPAS